MKVAIAFVVLLVGVSYAAEIEDDRPKTYRRLIPADVLRGI